MSSTPNVAADLPTTTMINQFPSAKLAILKQTAKHNFSQS